MLAKLLVLFTVVPLLELLLMLVLGKYAGLWPTVGLVFVTAIVGAILGKREGLRVWRAWREALAQGRMPEEGILGGVLVLVGSVLLVTPGVLTDVTGVLLLIPSTRRVIARHVRKRLEKHFAQSASHTASRGGASFHYRVDFGGAGFGGGT
ncbi:MAG: FxsA family protein, partial [Sandaracinaceae bacterium]|nr:FxsA family protein [Sandaracinaceae bacterium]